MESEQHSLKDLNLYLSEIKFSLKDVYFTLKVITHQYIKCCEDITVEIDKYYIEKGINLIFNVFKTILMYTKNLEVTKVYTFNSIYYYIEYISQIHNRDTEIVFVNLTLQDAILYVYRKSIYEISDSYKKKFKLTNDDKNKLNVINMLSIIYQGLYSYLFNDNIKITCENILPSTIKIEKFFDNILKKDKCSYNNHDSITKIYNNYSYIFESIVINSNDCKKNIQQYINKMESSLKN